MTVPIKDVWAACGILFVVAAIINLCLGFWGITIMQIITAALMGITYYRCKSS